MMSRPKKLTKKKTFFWLKHFVKCNESAIAPLHSFYPSTVQSERGISSALTLPPLPPHNTICRTCYNAKPTALPAPGTLSHDLVVARLTPTRATKVHTGFPRKTITIEGGKALQKTKHWALRRLLSSCIVWLVRVMVRYRQETGIKTWSHLGKWRLCMVQAEGIGTVSCQTTARNRINGLSRQSLMTRSLPPNKQLAGTSQTTQCRLQYCFDLSICKKFNLIIIHKWVLENTRFLKLNKLDDSSLKKNPSRLFHIQIFKDPVIKKSNIV